MPLHITEMSPADYDDVHALWKSTPGVGLTPDADSREGITSYLQRNPGLSFIARDNGHLIAAVLCGHDGRRGYLHHLAVLPAHRRRGIGKALTQKCLDKLAALGIEKCNVWVYGRNDDAQQFWRSIGWNTRTDLVIMQKMTKR